MSDHVPVLTIDGPSGSGKGTIARLLAKDLGWHLLDSGAIYRTLALFVIQQGCPLDDEDQIADLAQQLPVSFKDTQVFLHKTEVSAEIRSEACGATASKIAVFAKVRQALLMRQRAFSQSTGLVADGRDMGTVVFPGAFMKVYLDASAEERAKRRFLQLKDSGYDANIQDLVAEIVQRDVRDKTREVAPLKPAADAIIIDSSSMPITEVFNTIIEQARQRLSKF